MTDRRKDTRRETDDLLKIIQGLRQSTLKTARRCFWSGVGIGLTAAAVALLWAAILFDDADIIAFLNR